MQSNNLPIVVEENGPALGPAEQVVGRGLALQQVKSAYATAVAVQKPRRLAEVERRLLEEARLGAEEFYYGWRAGGEQIEGPSIDLAVAAARCWGNCVTDMLPVDERPDCWIFTAAFIDLETGYTRTRQFRQSKSSIVHGRLDEERKTDVRFQIGQSKAERNVIIKALPAGLIRKAMEVAKSGVRSKIEAYILKNGAAAYQDQILKRLAQYGVKEAAVLRKLGIAERKAIDVDHMVILSGDLAALEGGKDRPEELFPEEEKTAATVKDKIATHKAAKEAAKTEPPKTAEPEPIPTAEAPDREPGADDEGEPGTSDLQQAIESFRSSIRSSTSHLDLQQLGAQMMAQRAVLGEENYAALLVEYQKKYAVLKPAKKA